MMKRYGHLILLLCICSMAYAKPALRQPIPVALADGTVDTVWLHGDEHMHWMTRANGEWVTLRQGQLHPVAPLSVTQIDEMRMQAPTMRTAAEAGSELPINLASRGLIIMAEFPDLRFREENTQAAIDSMHNANDYQYDNGWWRADSSKYYSHPATGSVRQYFYDQSMGQYNPHFDVVGPVMADSSYIYYGHNVGMTKDVHIRELIREVVIKVDSMVDYSQYDNDNDGYVDYVYVIYAGYSEADGKGEEYIWPKKWSITPETLDGKKVSLFGCGSELNFRGTRDGIGTFVHEYGHIMGLPDLYPTVTRDTLTMSGVHKTLGVWDVMDYGPYNDIGNRPPSYSAYERWFFGWLTPVLLDTVQNDTLGYIGTTNQAYLISADDEMPDSPRGDQPCTYYLLENRQLTRWDATGKRSFANEVYIPHAGMLIEKIQYNPVTWRRYMVNNDPEQLGISLVPADGLFPTYRDFARSKGMDMGYVGKPGDVYPFTTSEGTLIDSMAIDSAHYLCRIRQEAGAILFGYLGGIADTLTNDTISQDTSESILPYVPMQETIKGIYTLSGQYVGTDIQQLREGLYIIRRERDGQIVGEKYWRGE